MSNTARDNIFKRLNRAMNSDVVSPASVCLPIANYSRSDKIRRLKPLMEAVRCEVHMVRRNTWTDTLKEVIKKRNIDRFLFSPGTAISDSIEMLWKNESDELPELCTYDGEIETFKEKLFDIDAAITTTVGAIAESGALVLWPDEKEPRLMSLVPPIHIAVLEADTIYNTFCEILQVQGWPARMPTNILLISGPSRTADIEMTVAFGVHGPKELIVLLVDN